MAKARVLAVDDQRYFREWIEGLLSEEGYDVQTAASGENAFSILLPEMERGRIASDEIAALGRIRIDSEHEVELVHVPSLPRFAPFWARAAHGALGTIFLMSGLVGEAASRLAPMMEAVQALPRSRVFHAVLLGKGDRLSPDELHENLSLIDEASLFLIPLETSKDPASLLSRLFARMVP
jgi:hypothetical protein